MDGHRDANDQADKEDRVGDQVEQSPKDHRRDGEDGANVYRNKIHPRERP